MKIIIPLIYFFVLSFSCFKLTYHTHPNVRVVLILLSRFLELKRPVVPSQHSTNGYHQLHVCAYIIYVYTYVALIVNLCSMHKWKKLWKMGKESVDFWCMHKIVKTYIGGILLLWACNETHACITCGIRSRVYWLRSCSHWIHRCTYSPACLHIQYVAVNPDFMQDWSCT